MEKVVGGYGIQAALSLDLHRAVSAEVTWIWISCADFVFFLPLEKRASSKISLARQPLARSSQLNPSFVKQPAPPGGGVSHILPSGSIRLQRREAPR